MRCSTTQTALVAGMLWPFKQCLPSPVSVQVAQKRRSFGQAHRLLLGEVLAVCFTGFYSLRFFEMKRGTAPFAGFQLTLSYQSSILISELGFYHATYSRSPNSYFYPILELRNDPFSNAGHTVK